MKHCCCWNAVVVETPLLLLKRGGCWNAVGVETLLLLKRRRSKHRCRWDAVVIKTPLSLKRRCRWNVFENAVVSETPLLLKRNNSKCRCLVFRNAFVVGNAVVAETPLLVRRCCCWNTGFQKTPLLKCRYCWNAVVVKTKEMGAAAVEILEISFSVNSWSLETRFVLLYP